MALNRLMLNSDPTAGRQTIFLGATEPRAARPRKEPAARRCSVGQGRLAVSISRMRFVILMFFRLAMKTSLIGWGAIINHFTIRGTPAVMHNPRALAQNADARHKIDADR